MELLLIRENVKIAVRERIHKKLVLNDRICFGVAMLGVLCGMLGVSLPVVSTFVCLLERDLLLERPCIWEGMERLIMKFN